jgi:DNA-binding transcriptional ArsR family regulator
MIQTARRIRPSVLRDAASIIKCLGHPLRLRLLEAMESGEKTVSELQDYARATQAGVSEQLAILRGRGVVGARRQGSFVYYRILEPKVTQILSCIRSCDVSSRRAVR